MTLRYRSVGAADATPLVMLHGMHDLGASLAPLAESLADRYRIIAPDLRGHGGSDQPGAYSIAHFLFDLHALAQHLELGRFHLFGHSLGGHIVSRFAALFPEQVRTLTIVEGLGPPNRHVDGDESAVLRGQREQLIGRMALTNAQRPLPNVGFAADRLRANNPRLPQQEAERLAELATRRNDAGDLVWAFDPRAQQVFITTSRQDNELHWRNVRCPTLVIAGDLAHEYWSAGVPAEAGWDGRFHGDDLPSRLRCFRDLTFHAFPGAGHMVHYDAPDELSLALAEFLENR